MPSRMCKDKTNVAIFGHKTQNASHNEIHTNAQITVYHLYAFIQQHAEPAGAMVLTSGILGSLHVRACPGAEQAASASYRLGSSWGTLTYSSGLISITPTRPCDQWSVRCSHTQAGSLLVSKACLPGKVACKSLRLAAPHQLSMAQC